MDHSTLIPAFGGLFVASLLCLIIAFASQLNDLQKQINDVKHRVMMLEQVVFTTHSSTPPGVVDYEKCKEIIFQIQPPAKTSTAFCEDSKPKELPKTGAEVSSCCRVDIQRRRNGQNVCEWCGRFCKTVIYIDPGLCEEGK